jgi:hypothetical protein
MMKKTRLAALMGGLLMGTAAAAAVVAPDFYSAPTAANLLARHGADDPGCDDHGTDLCAAGAGGSGEKLAKHGADDPGCDDHGTDLCVSKEA